MGHEERTGPQLCGAGGLADAADFAARALYRNRHFIGILFPLLSGWQVEVKSANRGELDLTNFGIWDKRIRQAFVKGFPRL